MSEHNTKDLIQWLRKSPSPSDTDMWTAKAWADAVEKLEISHAVQQQKAHSIHMIAKALEEERDEANNHVEGLKFLAVEAASESAELRKQRDILVAALKEITTCCLPMGYSEKQRRFNDIAKDALSACSNNLQ